MSIGRQAKPKESPSIDPQSRKLITVWIISITTLKLLASISLLFVVKPAQVDSGEFKLFISADSLLIGTIVIRVTKYYFPIPNQGSRSSAHEAASKFRKLIKL